MFNSDRYNELIGLTICPGCNGELSWVDSGMRCDRCSKLYPFMEGVVTFLPGQNRQWQDFSKRARGSLSLQQTVGYACSRNFDIVNRAVKLILNNIADSSVLDVGCGNGFMMEWLSKNNRIVGVDFVIDMLSNAVDSRLIPFHADATNLPFKKKAFDLVTSVETIQHIDDGEFFVKYLAQYVKPLGKILITGLSSSSLLRKTNRIIRRFFRPSGSSSIVPNLWDPIRLAAALKESGFTVDLYYTCFPMSKVVRDEHAIDKKHLLASNFLLLGTRHI